MIQDLLEQVNIEKEKKMAQIAETAKLKRALTLRDTDSVSNFSKEELNRYQQKISQQDKEFGEALIEIEKLKKNIEYYQCVLKNKDEIILKLESQASLNEQNGPHINRKFSVDALNKS